MPRASTSSGWSVSTAVAESTSNAEPNRYRVEIRRDEAGWAVVIVDPDGEDASVRACVAETEARTYASTVRQHIEWLSAPAFRRAYQLGE